MRMIFSSALINHPLHNALDEHTQHHQQQLFTIHASSPPAVKGGHQSTLQRFDKRQMGVQLSWKLEQYNGASTLFDINSMMSILTVFFQDSNPGYVSIMTLRV